MRILPRIVLHFFITLSLLVAACWGFFLQWDAVTEMENILNQGRETFQYVESLRSRFESLNTSWKARAVANAVLEEQERMGVHAAPLAQGDRDRDFNEQVARDLADAESLYELLLTNLKANADARHMKSLPVSLPQLEALFGKPKKSVEALAPAAPPETPGQASTGSGADALDRPRRAGMYPWTEEQAVSVRGEVDQAYRQLEASWDNEKKIVVQNARKAQYRVFVFLLITASLTLVSMLLLVRAVRRPLQRLMKATQHVATGPFDIDLPAPGQNDFSRLARAFNRMSAELAKAKKREADFLSVAAHELQTPLTLIRVIARRMRTVLAQDGAGRAEIEVDLDRVDTEVEKLSRKVFDLLDLGVIEAGQLALEVHELPSRGFLAMAANAFKPLAAEKKVRYEVAIEPSVPVLKFDPDRMNQVLLNLLDNAFKFTPSGGWVRFGAKTVSEKLEIEVSDSGPGIPPEKLDAIFEKYARARDPQTNRQIKGTGLGLAVARGIVTAHGGTIEARSVLGEGSTFVVRLPVGTSNITKEVA